MRGLLLLGLLILWVIPGMGEEITSKNATLGDALKSVIKEQGVLVRHGFFTGNDYRQQDDSYRSTYLMGVIDGFLFSPMFGAPKDGPLRRVELCVAGMQSSQVMALVDGFLLTRPVQWHEDMHSLTYQALLASCPK